VFGPPFAGTVGVAGGGIALGGEPVGVLFAFDDEDGVAVLDGCDDFGEPVDDSAGVAEFPFPAAVAVGAALPELFAGLAYDLEEEVAAFVDVVVDGGGVVAAGGGLVEEVSHGESKRGDDVLGVAARVAVENDTLVALGDGQRRVAVGVGWALGGPAGAAGAWFVAACGEGVEDGFEGCSWDGHAHASGAPCPREVRYRTSVT